MVDRLRRIWPSFSLIEVLIVLGIIAALAAAIVPQFVGRGSDERQRDSELSSVQNAIDSMMAELGLSSVAANDGGRTTAFRDWDSEENPLRAGLGQSRAGSGRLLPERAIDVGLLLGQQRPGHQADGTTAGTAASSRRATPGCRPTRRLGGRCRT